MKIAVYLSLYMTMLMFYNDHLLFACLRERTVKMVEMGLQDCQYVKYMDCTCTVHYKISNYVYACTTSQSVSFLLP